MTLLRTCSHFTASLAASARRVWDVSGRDCAAAVDGLEDACEVVEGEDGTAPDMREELVELWRVLGRRRSALFVNACGRPSEATCYSVEGRQARCKFMWYLQAFSALKDGDSIAFQNALHAFTAQQPAAVVSAWRLPLHSSRHLASVAVAAGANSKMRSEMLQFFT